MMEGRKCMVLKLQSLIDGGYDRIISFFILIVYMFSFIPVTFSVLFLYIFVFNSKGFQFIFHSSYSYQLYFHQCKSLFCKRIFQVFLYSLFYRITFLYHLFILTSGCFLFMPDCSFLSVVFYSFKEIMYFCTV